MFSDISFCKENIELGFSKVHNAELIIANNINELKKKINKEKGWVIVLGSALNREAACNKKVDIILSPHMGILRDHMNSRNSGLNDTVCKIAKKNKIAVGISFSEILNSKGITRAEKIGRIMQNIRLCRKYKVQMILANFATNKKEMRGPRDLMSFGIVLGMTPKEAEQSLTNMDEIIKKKNLEKRTIAEGITEA